MPLTSIIKEALLDPETPSTALLVIASDLLGEEMLQWDPTTIRMELAEVAAADIPPAVLNRLMAAIEMVTTDGFYKDLPTFIRLCNALFNGTLDSTTFDPADAAEIAWGITEALLIWPPERDDDEPFDEKIVGYIGHVLADEGILQPPDVLGVGKLPTDMRSRIHANYSDDPTMYAAIHEVEKAKTDEINQLVKTRLAQLLGLLDALPLQTGSAEGAVRDMFKALDRQEEESDKLRPV